MDLLVISSRSALCNRMASSVSVGTLCIASASVTSLPRCRRLNKSCFLWCSWWWWWWWWWRCLWCPCLLVSDLKRHTITAIRPSLKRPPVKNSLFATFNSEVFFLFVVVFECVFIFKKNFWTNLSVYWTVFGLNINLKSKRLFSIYL